MKEGKKMKDAVSWSEIFKNVAAGIASLVASIAALRAASKKKKDK